jgi:Protease II
LLQDLEIFENYWVTFERFNGLNKVVIHSWNNKETYKIPFDGETYSICSSYNPNFKTKKIRYKYNSLSTPNSIMEFDMKSRKLKILKTQLVNDKSFKSNNYIEKRIWANAKDGTKIPISMIYNKKTNISSSTPLLQYAYGSYGYTIDPSFSISLISLLDRGFIYAICHVRGGDYLGRKWYEDGKLLNKKNTFEDFICCSNLLIKKGYTSSKHLYAYGGSAGGLLMGVIINKNSKLYNGIIADVPFVDVINTMLDETIPLTTGEYDEWGNPKILKYYNYINSYSPYDNVKKERIS